MILVIKIVQHARLHFAPRSVHFVRFARVPKALRRRRELLSVSTTFSRLLKLGEPPDFTDSLVQNSCMLFRTALFNFVLHDFTGHRPNFQIRHFHFETDSSFSLSVFCSVDMQCSSMCEVNFGHFTSRGCVKYQHALFHFPSYFFQATDR